MNHEQIREPDAKWEYKCGQPLLGRLLICDECKRKQKRGKPLPPNCTNKVVIDLTIKH